MTMAVAAAFTFGSFAQAAPLYWDGNDITAGAGNTTLLLNKFWGTDSVWNSDAAGVTATFTAVTVATDDLFFVAAPSATSGNLAFNPTVTGTQEANSITFQSSGAQTLSGGAINLGAGGLVGSQYAYGTTNRGTVTISSAIALLASQSWVNNATTSMTVSGAVSGPGNLTKAGVGTLVLSGTGNTYGGTTTVSAGTLQATNTGALPGFDTAGRVAVGGGATLTLNAGTTGALFTLANLDTVRSTVTFGANSRLGIDTGSASFTYGSTITDTAGGALGLLKQGANTLTLSATDNTYSGGTFINGGTVNFAALDTLGTGSITFNGGTLQYATGKTMDISARTVTLTGAGTIDTNGNNVTFANSIGNSGTGAFTKTGAGILTLAAANLYTGVTTVNGGILSVSDNNQLGSGTAAIGFTGGSVSTYGGVLRITGSAFSTSRAITNSSQLAFGIDVTAGATATFTNTGNNSNGGYASGVVFGSTSTTANSPGGTLNYAGSFGTVNNNNGAGSTGPTIGIRFRNITANVTGIFNAGNNSVTNKNDSGNITVGPGAGETTVVNLNGTGQFIGGGGANTANSVSVGGNPQTGTDNSGGTVALPSVATLNINSTNTGAIQSSNFYVAHNGTTTATVNQNAGGVVLTTALTLGSTGSAANGTYNLGNGPASLASLTTPAIVKGAGTATFNFNGGILNATSTSSAASFLGTVNATVDAGGARINSGAFNVGIAQGLLHNPGLGATADGGLTKTGTGSLTLNGANTYTGATAINAGSLVVNGSLGVSAVSVNATGTLTGTGSFGGSVTVASDGHLALAVAATPGSQVPLPITGALTLQGGNILDLTATPTPANGVYTLATAAGGVTYTAGTVNFIGGSGVVSASGNNLILTVGAGVANYASWATANSIGGQPATGDFDNDGLSNLVEYALGKSPTVSSQPAGTLSPAGLLSFTKGTEAVANGDVTYGIEQSTDLVTWNSVPPTVNDTSTISYTLPTSQSKQFARLKVVQIP